MSTSAPPRTKTLLFYCFLALVFCLSANAQSRFDSDIRWPLCGNWYLDSLPYDPYTAFTSAIDCPSTRVGAGYADLVQAPFGPRHLGPSLTYDWHRGIDLPTKHSGDTPEVSRRPVYAMSPGRVLQCKKSDPSSSGTIPCTMADSETSCLLNPGGSGCDNFPDIRLLVEHERPGNTSRCFPSGCYYTRYVHLSRVLPAFVHPMGASVTAGQFLGLTGHSETGTFNHLHFEVRVKGKAQNPLDFLPARGG